MGLANKIKLAEDAVEEKDVVGGGSSFVWESDIYPVILDLVYITERPTGSHFINVVMKDAEDRQLSENFCVRSGNEKGNKTTYERDGKTHNLPGLNTVNSMAMHALGEAIDDIDTEDKVAKLWSYEDKAEVNTTVEMYTPLLNNRVDVAVLKKVVDKREQGDDGQWRSTGETKEINEVVKFLCPETGRTLSEVTGEQDSTFKEKWLDRWKGEVKNEATGAGVTPTPATTATTAVTTKSLFPNKK